MTPQEELAALRHLIEKQQKEIAEKDAVIEKQNDQIEKQGAQLEKQRIQIENMIQALLQARKKNVRSFYGSNEAGRGAAFSFLKKRKSWRNSLVWNKKRSRLSSIPGHHANQVSGLKCLPACKQKSKNIPFRKGRPAANAAGNSK